MALKGKDKCWTALGTRVCRVREQNLRKARIIASGAVLHRKDATRDMGRKERK